eukprot:4053363-Amphidinium_carterae.2
MQLAVGVSTKAGTKRQRTRRQHLKREPNRNDKTDPRQTTANSRTRRPNTRPKRTTGTFSAKQALLQPGRGEATPRVPPQSPSPLSVSVSSSLSPVGAPLRKHCRQKAWY